MLNTLNKINSVNIYYAPGAILGTEEGHSMNKRSKVSVLRELPFYLGRQTIMYENKYRSGDNNAGENKALW